MHLMAVDIGNTNVVIGFIDDGRIAGTYRITTKANHTSDEYGLMITQFLALSGYKPADVDDVIISSVVPKVMHSFRASIVKFLDIDPMIVGPGIKTGLNNRMAALGVGTAQRPEVEITRPKSFLAKATKPAMQAGLYYNFLGGIERTIAQFHKEIDEDFRVVATGGLSRVFADDTDMIDIYDPDLIFKGMRHIYDRNVR